MQSTEFHARLEALEAQMEARGFYNPRVLGEWTPRKSIIHFRRLENDELERFIDLIESALDSEKVDDVAS